MPSRRASRGREGRRLLHSWNMFRKTRRMACSPLPTPCRCSRFQFGTFRRDAPSWRSETQEEMSDGDQNKINKLIQRNLVHTQEERNSGISIKNFFVCGLEMHSQCICATLNCRWTASKLNWKLTFFPDPHLGYIYHLILFVVRANAIIL